MRVRVRAAGSGCGCGPTMNVILNFSMRVRVRVRAAGGGDVRVIAAKDQRIYFNCGCVLRVRAEYEQAFNVIKPKGVARGEGGKSPPPRNRKNCCRKLVLFPKALFLVTNFFEK